MVDDAKKRTLAIWALVICIILLIGIFLSVFLNNNTVYNNVNESKDNIAGSQNSAENLNNDDIQQIQSAQSVVNQSSNTTITGGVGGGAGGGGGGGSSSTPAGEIIGVQTFFSLEELFNANTQLGNNIIVHGIAFQIAGSSMSDKFFFTDDERAMNDPNYLKTNSVDYHITVYNNPNTPISQGITDVEGTIVKCDYVVDGKYCVDANIVE
ncbi:MAG: hypothetical protein ACP5NV_00165 [Candidatus Woesearchaeota archaeon]